MAIEIKELLVKFSVEDSESKKGAVKQELNLNSREIKEIINYCTEEVLRKISMKEER